jgi:hypothetical protein
MIDDERPLLLSDPGAGPPPVLRDALLAARDDGPRDADLARLAARLPVAPLPPPPVAAPPSVLSGALIGAALGVLVAGAGLFWDARREPPPRPAPAAVAPPPASPPRAAPAARDPVDAPRPAHHAVTAPPSGAAVPAPASASTAVVDPLAAAPGDAPPAAAPGAGPIGAGPVARESLRDEVELISRARDRIGASPAEALAITQEHARQFPGGTLAQEREVLAIEALHRLGRTGEARARRDRFLSAYPGSAYKKRFEALFGD